MNKKIISAVLVIAAALSMSASAFAASAADPTHHETDVETEMSIPVINITWPTSASVVLNPYRMKVNYTDETGARSGTSVSGAEADSSTIISPELVFSNKGSSDVAITVTGSVTATTTVNERGELLGVDKFNNPITAVSSKISFATSAIEQPSFDSEGNFIAGETDNVILLYLEVGQPVTDNGGTTYTYTGVYDENNNNQMLLGTKNTSKKLFTIPAENGSANIKICGDMSTNPTIGWDRIADTEEINVKLVFDASPVAPVPDKPVYNNEVAIKK